MWFKYFCICVVSSLCINDSTCQHYACPEDELLCEDTCYNPAEKQCLRRSRLSSFDWDYFRVTSGYDKPSIVCNAGQETCGYSCFSPESQTCFYRQQFGGENENQYGKCYYNSYLYDNCRMIEAEWFICATTEELCGSKCFSPESQQCFRDEYVCERDEDICGSICISPKTHVCSTGGYKCKINEDSCDGKCISLKTHVCSKGQLCQVNEEFCDGKCISLETQKCFFDGIICSVAHLPCGWTCYDPLSHTCAKGKIIDRQF